MLSYAPTTYIKHPPLDSEPWVPPGLFFNQLSNPQNFEFMVTVVNYHRHSNAEGEEYFTLELRGDLEMVQSQSTGRFYASTNRCYVSSTFDENTCKLMIGKSIPGSIVKKEVEQYDYTVPESGEVIQLTHRWEFQPEVVEERKLEQAVFED